MEVARRNSTLDDELLRMQQENQRREVDFDAEQAHSSMLNKHDSSSNENRNNLLLKMNKRDSKNGFLLNRLNNDNGENMNV